MSKLSQNKFSSLHCELSSNSDNGKLKFRLNKRSIKPYHENREIENYSQIEKKQLNIWAWSNDGIKKNKKVLSLIKRSQQKNKKTRCSKSLDKDSQLSIEWPKITVKKETNNVTHTKPIAERQEPSHQNCSSDIFKRDEKDRNKN